MAEPKITSTYYSDGKRQITVLWDSPTGDRKVLNELTEIIEGYFNG